MKKYFLILPIVFTFLTVIFLVNRKDAGEPPKVDTQVEESNAVTSDKTDDAVTMSNPASDFCVDNGGKSEIVTESDGSQFGLCVFEDYSCEEWGFYRNECDIEGDEEAITEILIEKGLNLTDMKVVIKKHLGKYIEAAVTPVSAIAGGGYVFAVKDAGEIKILADGNGAIMCSFFDEYPDFSSYLVPECIDDNGIGVSR